MEANNLNHIINNIGLIQQTVAAILLTLLFLILNSNKKLATWLLFLAWLWLSISLVASLLLTGSLFQIGNLNQGSSLWKLIISEFFVLGRGLFFIFLFSAVRSLCDVPENQYQLKRQLLVWTWLLISIVTIFITDNPNHYFIIQAPLAIFLLARSGQLLLNHYPGVGIGNKIVPALVFYNMILWILFLMSYPTFIAHFFDQNGFNVSNTREYFFIANVLGEVLLGLALLITITEKYSKILQLANGQIQQFNGSFKKQSYLDGLTGSQNLNALEFHFSNMNFTKNQTSTLVVCDLENLKIINAQQGHSFGDQLLIVFVEYIKRSLREGDNIYRIGGDKFVIWMQNCSFVLANNRFKNLISNVPNIEDDITGLTLHFNYGCVAIIPETPLQEMIDEADQLMRHHK